jgi:hypothetical protein
MRDVLSDDSEFSKSLARNISLSSRSIWRHNIASASGGTPN